MRRIVFEFEDDALAALFRGWMSDGGGEQGFMDHPEAEDVDLDYDGDVVRVRGRVLGQMKRRSHK